MAKNQGPTQMMLQYLNTKEKYKDCILLYRLGDFYEMFMEDAEIGSRVLDLALTGRGKDDHRMPMCGIPYHACEPYVAKLLQSGYKVAICEQLSEPSKDPKVLVKRDVVRVITPGTVIDSQLIDESKSNYLASIFKDKDNIGLSYIEISTGEFFMTEFSGNNIFSELNDALVRIKPSEILCNEEMKEFEKDIPCIYSGYVAKLSVISSDNYDYKEAESLLKQQLNVTSLKSYNCATRVFGICSAGALLKYVFETQKRTLQHINDIKYVINSDYMQIDANTRKNLELTETIRDRKRRGSLFWLLDRTETKMGSRLLCNFIEQPLFDDKKINYRSKGVEELFKNIYIREEIKSNLHDIYDLERLCGRISYNNVSPKECISLKNSLNLVPSIKELVSKFDSTIFKDIYNDLYDFGDIVELIDKSIVDNPPMLMKDGHFIKEGFDPTLDELINIQKNGANILLELEQREKERTGIKNLKVKFNKVFGYFIEVTNSQKELVPYDYIRKQTTTNGERFITEELKTIEDKVLHAQEKRIQLENHLFEEIRQKLLTKLKELQASSRAIALLDVITSLAVVAAERNYTKPIIDKTGSVIEIIDGRHPVVEAINKSEDFVPNDTILNSSDCRTMIITGPNMAGKSTYMRQVALITLMAQIGSFVPARSAKIGLVDRIFTRIGASDDLSTGQSTFMVEMNEVSNILKNATNNSLIILDEVGRGTSTFDGLSIAWSVMEFVSTHLCAKTLFATHYHELTDLEGVLEGVKNYRINVKEYNNNVIFLRKIVRGGTNKSFGIEVAKLAGLPSEVISRAREILAMLEESQLNNNISKLEPNDNATKKNQNLNKVMQILNDLDVNTLTPLNAFDVLIDLKNQIKD